PQRIIVAKGVAAPSLDGGKLQHRNWLIQPVPAGIIVFVHRSIEMHEDIRVSIDVEASAKIGNRVGSGELYDGTSRSLFVEGVIVESMKENSRRAGGGVLDRVHGRRRSRQCQAIFQCLNSETR